MPADTAATGTLTILYGSQTGNAEYLAHEIRDKAESDGIDASVSPLDGWLDTGAPSLDRLLVVTSTHDNGHMPDNAANFWRWLQNVGPGVAKGLPYAVLAIGDSMYDDFCKAGHDIDERLAELGAVRIVDTIDCDVDFEFSAPKWAASATAALMAVEPWSSTLASVDSAAGDAQERSTTGDAVDAPDAADAVREAVVVDARRLSGPASDKAVWHYELEFVDGPFAYEPGDSLAVYPTNSTALLEAWQDAFVGQGVDVVDLVRDRELRIPHPGLILALARLRPARGAVAQAMTLASTDRRAFEEWLWGRDVLNVLEDLACLDVPLGDLVSDLRPLQRRDYSISSSPAHDEGRVHLTLGGVEYDRLGRQHRGVATSFLAERARDSAPFQVRRLPAHDFRPPVTDAPVIMIGPGVGVAPFRAFLRHRAALGSAGRNWLFFGDRRRDEDWLYRDEIEELQHRGVLERLDLAWSRDDAPKTYVQDRMLEQADELRSWIDEGAYVFVCGDKARMAPDVDRALERILGDGDEVRGRTAVDALKASGRYVKDIY